MTFNALKSCTSQKSKVRKSVGRNDRTRGPSLSASAATDAALMGRGKRAPKNVPPKHYLPTSLFYPSFHHLLLVVNKYENPLDNV